MAKLSLWAAIALVASLVTSVPSAGAQADESAPVGALVPLPSGGSSDLTGVVEPGAAPSPAAASSASAPLDGDLTRIHVKFADGAAVARASGGVVVDEPSVAAALETAGARIVPLFDRTEADLAADRVLAERRTGRAQPDLAAWYLVTVADSRTGARLTAELTASAAVEMAQPEPQLAVTQVPEEEDRQGYLDAAPTGVDAEWAWERAGGTGRNVRIVAIDSGFDTAHPDMDRASAPGVAIPHAAAWDSSHGLQVLGILAADDDDGGLKGMAHEAALNTVNSGRTSSELANAIDLAANASSAGDVITISQGVCAVTGCADGVVLPLVHSSSARDALRVAAGRGIVTVVSAGNGGTNLDAYESRLGDDSPDTIVVGAGNGASGNGCGAVDGPQRGRVASSNFGVRVDLQGWGSCVRTATSGGGYRWWGFTSAATPQVAGAAALLSSLAQEQGATLTGSQIRGLLESTGSPQVFAGTRGGSIGPLPDVRQAIDAIGSIPANDMFDEARDVTALPFVQRLDARLAGVEADEPSLTCGSVSNTLWYRYTPAAATTVTITTEGSDFDGLVGLWRLRDDSLERVDCADDVTVNNPDSSLTATLEAGVTYFVQVGGNGGDAGPMRFQIASAAFAGVGCDIDDDGRGDVVTGSPDEDLTGGRNAGRALVLYGGGSVRPARFQSVSQEWPGVAGASERGDGFGASVACGDFDGDGYDDVAIGSPKEDVGRRTNAGSVRVVYGGRSGLTQRSTNLSQSTPGIQNKPENGDWFGSALVAGDFDGDGHDDLAISAKGEDVGSVVDTGVVHVVHGTSSGLDSGDAAVFRGSSAGVPNSGERGDKFGATLAAGDFDNNGFDDLVIGVPSEDLSGEVNAGAVFVLPGSAGGVTTSGSIALHQGIAAVDDTPEAADRFGQALAVGDIDGDGFDELAVGVPGEDLGGLADAGAVHVFSGSVFGLDPERSQFLSQDTRGVRGVAEEGDAFGSSVAIADLTGDGHDELVVAAAGEGVRSRSGAGLVHVLDGSDDGLTFAGDQVVTQNSPGVPNKAEAGDGLGDSVTAVDLDGNGRFDVVIGIPGEDLGGVEDAGQVLVVPGSATGVARKRAEAVSQKSLDAGSNEAGDAFGATLHTG